MGILMKYTVCLVILSSLYLSLEAQNVVGLAAAPVGTYQYQGPRGEREHISSIGNAKVGIFRKVQPPRIAVIPVRRPVRPEPPVEPPVKPVHPPPPKKSPGVGYRQGLLGGLVPGLLGGLLGGGR